MLIHVSSIAEFLNQAEYTSAINQYDRNMLTAYQELTEQIKKTEKGTRGAEGRTDCITAGKNRKSRKKSTA